MYHVIGDKNDFAVEFQQVTAPEEWKSNDLWIKSAIWINGCRVGDWDDLNMIGPFARSLYRIARKFEGFWLADLEGLHCRELFYKIHPHFDDPDLFYELSDEQQLDLCRFDKFALGWGENFDRWTLDMVYKDGKCEFLWVHDPWGDNTSDDDRNNIQCFTVKLTVVQRVFEEFTKLIPNKDWPTLIPKS